MAELVTQPADVDRKTLVLGVSLKLYLDVKDTVQWSKAVSRIVRNHPAVLGGRVRLFVLPTLPALPRVLDAFEGTTVAVGAQDLFWEDRGPFTGAISGADLRSVGCTYVEVGHAERRSLFEDDDLAVRRKFAAALRNGLTPVLCVGETVESDAATAAAETCAQLESAIAEVGRREPVCDVVIAYEPQWAIGQAEPATSAHVGAVVEAIRERLDADGRIRSTAVLYGGSAQQGTLSALAGRVDGLFLGRFAHDPQRFSLILDEAAMISDRQVRRR